MHHGKILVVGWGSVLSQRVQVPLEESWVRIVWSLWNVHVLALESVIPAVSERTPWLTVHNMLRKG